MLLPLLPLLQHRKGACLKCSPKAETVFLPHIATVQNYAVPEVKQSHLNVPSLTTIEKQVNAMLVNFSSLTETKAFWRKMAEVFHMVQAKASKPTVLWVATLLCSDIHEHKICHVKKICEAPPRI